ncbi:hypothetical protein DENSPDRAFT_429876 [Dentipellis sp. KUC8613]|nr:hypothetical protein DENSPDRAFT_429876 [Dentipellis sp. KUC8613]
MRADGCRYGRIWIWSGCGYGQRARGKRRASWHYALRAAPPPCLPASCANRMMHVHVRVHVHVQVCNIALKLRLRGNRRRICSKQTMVSKYAWISDTQDVSLAKDSESGEGSATKQHEAEDMYSWRCPDMMLTLCKRPSTCAGRVRNSPVTICFSRVGDHVRMHASAVGIHVRKSSSEAVKASESWRLERRMTRRWRWRCGSKWKDGWQAASQRGANDSASAHLPMQQPDRTAYSRRDGQARAAIPSLHPRVSTRIRDGLARGHVLLCPPANARTQQHVRTHLATATRYARVNVSRTRGHASGAARLAGMARFRAQARNACTLVSPSSLGRLRARLMQWYGSRARPGCVRTQHAT